MKPEDYYEKGWREALASAAKETRAAARKYRKLARDEKREGWKAIAAVGAETALTELAAALAVASKKPKP